MKSRTLLSWVGIAAIIVLFVAINTVSYVLFKGARLDLTEDKLYTLSEGTRNILRDIDEPITLRFYYSKELAREFPVLETYGTVVGDLLGRYRDIAGGGINLEVINPEPFSEAEDNAVLAGMEGFPVNAGGDNIYFGLEGVNSIDQREVIPFFTPDRERFLEYDLTEMVYRLAQPNKPVVGVMSSLPVLGDTAPPNPMQPQAQRQQPWFMFQQLGQLYEVRDLGAAPTDIDGEIDILVVVHPKDLPAESEFAIDQFILSGRPAAIFVDPHCEPDAPPADPQNPYNQLFADRDSGLAQVLAQLGLSLPEREFVGDMEFAQAVVVQNERGVRERMNYVGYLGVRGDSLNEDNVITANLDVVNFLFPGELARVEGASTTITPLAETSGQSMRIGTDAAKYGTSPRELVDNFEPSGQRKLLAARVTGPVETAFPGGNPAGNGDGQDGFLAGSVEDGVNVLVVADVDMLTDAAWVQVQRFAGQAIGIPIASNRDFVMNALETLAGGVELTRVRSRGQFARPFTLVEELTRQAEARHREREQALQQELEDTQRRINELQAERGTGGAVILSEEQLAEVDRLNERFAETRRELRAVRLDLRRDIDGLGQRLALLNMFAVPGVVVLAAFAVLAFRGTTRRRRT